MLKERLKYIDVLETIAIFLVVYCHNTLTIGTSLFANLTLVFTTTVAVPIFFLANGTLLFNSNFDLKKHLKKIVFLVSASFLWKLIYLLARYAMSGFNFRLYSLSTVLNYLGKDLVLDPFIPTLHFWFLYALIAIYVVYPIFRWIYDKNMVVYGLILVALFVYACSFDWRSKDVTIEVMAASYLLMFLLGPVVHKFFYDQGVGKKRYLLIPVAVLAYLVLVYQKYKFTGTLTGTWARLPDDYQRTATLVLGVSLYAFFATIDFKESKFFEAISSRTMNVYMIHMLFCFAFEGLVYPHLPFANVFVHLVRTALIFVVSLAVTEPLAYIPALNKLLSIKPKKLKAKN